MTSDLYIGLMSGTSMDGTDVVIVDLIEQRPKLLASLHTPHPNDLKKRLEKTQSDDRMSLADLGHLDTALGEHFAGCINALLKQANVSADDITAIGSHGQTLYHDPSGEEPFTMQMGDPNIIAARTGIATIADFRRRDVALGGQGAPLTPAFHAYLFGTGTPCCVVNIGGIGNITALDCNTDKPVLGYDTGPGNTLLDYWCMQHRNEPFDNNGQWAAENDIDNTLLNTLLNDAYFSLPFPKSTGREYFNPTWLQQHINSSMHPGVIQATLTALTADSLALSLNHHLKSGKVWVAGGGANNKTLMTRLQTQCPTLSIVDSSDVGFDTTWIEAMAFAWLARQTCHRQAGNIPAVTGASAPAILGGIWL